MTRRRAAALLAAWLNLASAVGLAAPAASQPVDVTLCGPLPATLEPVGAAAIGGNWPHYRPYMRACPIKDAQGVVGLTILALDLPAADAAQDLLWKDGHRFDQMRDARPADPVPLPVVLDAHNEPVGSLPQQLIDEPPVSTAYAVMDWQNGFPHRMTLRIDDPTQDTPARSPYCPPPVRWNEHDGKFVQDKGRYYASCR